MSGLGLMRLTRAETRAPRCLKRLAQAFRQTRSICKSGQRMGEVQCAHEARGASAEPTTLCPLGQSRQRGFLVLRNFAGELLPGRIIRASVIPAQNMAAELKTASDTPTEPTATLHQPAGQRLRSWRTARRLTLKAVSEQTGIPVPALSKLENGKQSLGYPRLLRLSELLGVELGQLLSADVRALPIAQPMGRRSINRHDEGHTFDDDRLADRYLATDLRQKSMTPIICDVTARFDGEREVWSRHAGEEFVLVLSGVLELHSEIYAPVVLAPGDSIYFDAAVGHNYFSADGGICRFLSVVESPPLEGAGRHGPLRPTAAVEDRPQEAGATAGKPRGRAQRSG